MLSLTVFLFTHFIKVVTSDNQESLTEIFLLYCQFTKTLTEFVVDQGNTVYIYIVFKKHLIPPTQISGHASTKPRTTNMIYIVHKYICTVNIRELPFF